MKNIQYREMSEASFKQLVIETIQKEEDSIPFVYVDGVGIPTSFNGKAMVVKSGNRWVVDPVAEAVIQNVTGQGYDAMQRSKLDAATENLNRYGRGMTARRANMVHFYAAGTTDSFAERTRKPENSTFGLELKQSQLNEANEIVVRNTINAFDAKMAREGIAIPPSQEKAALVSIYHQCPRCIGDKTIRHLKNGNREGVLYEIQNDMDSQKFRSRRQREAELFGSDTPSVSAGGVSDTVDRGGNLQQPNKPQASVLDSLRNPPPLPRTVEELKAAFTVLQHANSVVQVAAYTRRDGTQVPAHTRGAPDGDSSNNVG